MNNETTPAPLSAEEEKQLLEWAKDPEEFMSNFGEREKSHGETLLATLLSLDAANARADAAEKHIAELEQARGEKAQLEEWILAAATPPSSRPFDGQVKGKADLWQMAYENIRSWRNSGFCAMFWEPDRGWAPIRIELESQGYPFYRLTDGTAVWEMIKEWETRARLNAEEEQEQTQQ